MEKWGAFKLQNSSDSRSEMLSDCETGRPNPNVVMDPRVVRLNVQLAPNVARDLCVVRLKVWLDPHVVKDETPPEITRGGRSSVSTVAHGPIIKPKTT